jgi:hypothetical protein
MKFFSKIGVLVILGACIAFAGDVAVLSNGFSIRHDHRAVLQQTTRLYFTSGNDSYVDIPTAEIIRFDKDNTPAQRRGTSAPASPDVNDAVTSSPA